MKIYGRRKKKKDEAIGVKEGVKYLG